MYTAYLEAKMGIPVQGTWKESEMLRLKQMTWLAAFLGALVMSASSAHARDIGGTISSTLTITEDSQLVDDVTCTVTGAACIALGVAGMTLDLNGFTMTGLASATPCAFTAAGGPEFGIVVNAFNNVTIRGPGLVQRFRATGVILIGSSGSTVRDVTSSTNCSSGFQVVNGSNNLLENNVSVRNANPTVPCGGI